MHCLHCNAAITLIDTECPSCGRSLDANADGVPDALERLIESKARALIAQQKAEEQAAIEATARARADAAARAERQRLAAEQEAARRRPAEQLAAELALRKREIVEITAKLRVNEATPFRRLFFPIWLSIPLFALSILFGLFAMGCEGYLGHSISGPLFCRYACDTCEGPGRVEVISSSGTSNGTTSTSYEWTQTCNVQFRDGGAADRAEPTAADRHLSMWWGFPVYVLGSFLVGVLALPPAMGRARNKRLALEQQNLIAALEMRHRFIQMHERAPPTGAYR